MPSTLSSEPGRRKGRKATERQLRVPKYQLVYSLFLSKLDREYVRGEQIPTSAELCTAFGYSRMTVEQALQMLEQDGIIRREQGRGSFYIGPKRRRAVTTLGDVLDSLMDYRGDTYAKVIRKGTVFASTRIAERLGVEKGARVVEIQRVGVIANEPIIFITAWLPVDTGAIFLGAEEEKLKHQTLISILTTEHRLEIGSVKQTIGAVLADPSFATYLGVAVGAPVLENERTYFNKSALPLLATHAFYRSDRYRFEISMKDWK